MARNIKQIKEAANSKYYGTSSNVLAMGRLDAEDHKRFTVTVEVKKSLIYTVMAPDSERAKCLALNLNPEQELMNEDAVWRLHAYEDKSPFLSKKIDAKWGKT